MMRRADFYVYIGHLHHNCKFQLIFHCMLPTKQTQVFHVCALTDDGLIMKSFLCPESTLFDQTILKCNWWFYVDCKNSKNIYDSNLPVSKSYQLMKALTFFSKYKHSQNEKNAVDIEALKNSVSSSAENGNAADGSSKL